MRTRSVVLILGIVALAAVAIAVSQRAVTVHVRFASGEGLAAGAPIRAQGVAVGELTGVELDTEGRVLATARIDHEAARKIPSDSLAILSPGGIDLILGDAEQPIRSGITLPGYRSLAELRLDATRDTVRRLFEQLQKSVEDLARTLGEKGRAAQEILREEMERLRRKLEEELPEPEEPDSKPKSI